MPVSRVSNYLKELGINESRLDHPSSAVSYSGVHGLLPRNAIFYLPQLGSHCLFLFHVGLFCFHTMTSTQKLRKASPYLHHELQILSPSLKIHFLLLLSTFPQQRAQTLRFSKTDIFSHRVTHNPRLPRAEGDSQDTGFLVQHQ